MIIRVLKYLLFSLISYALICLATPFCGLLKKRSVQNQISYLNKIMMNGLDDRLQERFPEGKVFSNALFTLSIIEFSTDNEIEDTLYTRIIDNNLERLLSYEAKLPFNKTMIPKYGMFFNGWSLYTLKRFKGSNLFKHSKIRAIVDREIDKIESRLYEAHRDSIIILDSYAGMGWPADNMLGIISLDDTLLLEFKFQKKWLNKIFTNSAHSSGLINHIKYEPEVIRGSSQAMITYFLSEIDYRKIQEYNNVYNDLFVDNYLGIHLVREYEDGSSDMDVDSGPVILGYGASATIMNIKTQASIHTKNSRSTWALLNTISLPINLFGEKFYLFKKEPMFDIFMLWGSVGLH